MGNMENRRKAEAARQQAEKEKSPRAMEGSMRKGQISPLSCPGKKMRRRQAEWDAKERENRERKAEARRRALEQEAGQCQAEREAIERCHGQEQHERERQERERPRLRSRTPSVTRLLRVYEDKWAALCSNTGGVGQLNFDHLPWPSLENVENVKDITDERVRVFMDHRERFQDWRRATLIRSELLRCAGTRKFSKGRFLAL